jgi:hypothetical protein
MKSFKNKLWGSPSPKKELTDLVDVTIYKEETDESKETKRITLASGEGSWLSYLEFDKKTYWIIAEEFPEWEIPFGSDG